MFNVHPDNPELGAVTPYTVNEKCRYLRKHFDRIEKVFEVESEELWAASLAENERTKDHEDDSEHDYRHSDSLREIEFISLRMHRYSSILSSYAYLENSMNKLCEEYHIAKQLPLDPSQVKGEGIERSKLYLSKLAELDFDKINKEWSQLQILNALRNCIIHADGDVNLTRKKLDNIINNTPGLSFVDNSLIMMEASYIHSAVDAIQTLLLHLSEAGR